MSQTLSSIIDSVVKVFSETKRPQLYFPIKRGPGDFYYYTFLGSIFSRNPLRVYYDDLMMIDGYAQLNKQESRAVIYQAIRKFLGDNGHYDLIERMVRDNKLDVIAQ